MNNVLVLSRQVYIGSCDDDGVYALHKHRAPQKKTRHGGQTRAETMSKLTAKYMDLSQLKQTYRLERDK